MAIAERLNPPATALGSVNAVMGGAGNGPHHVRDFEGPLSIKFMVRGAGVWRTDAGVHHADEGYFLVLNHGQTYSLDIEGKAPRESFCPFFRRGFVEDVSAGRVLGSVFDGAQAGLFTGSDPLVTADEFGATTAAVFGRRVDVVLCASSHRSLVAWCDGILIADPGSPTLAERTTVAVLHLLDDHVRVEVIAV